jgi:putative endonuclease
MNGWPGAVDANLARARVDMDDRAALGRVGEREAERFLRRLRYRIVTRNYRCAPGELDLVALDGQMIVFVEVKTRSDADHADPQDAVTPVKQQHLTRAAEFFLRYTHSEHRPCRFDVLAITCKSDGGFAIEHFIDAFAPAR